MTIELKVNSDSATPYSTTDRIVGCSEHIESEQIEADEIDFELLSGINKLEAFISKDQIYLRQLATQGLVEILAEGPEEVYERVFVVVKSLSTDQEAIIRASLAEKLFDLVNFCYTKNSPSLIEFVSTEALPIFIKCLTDTSAQVRSNCMGSISQLLQHNFLDKDLIEKEFLSVIIKLTDVGNEDEMRSDAVTLMSILMRYFELQTTELYFLPLFLHLCCDPVFQVRKICAAHFGDLCLAVGQKNTETHLLSKFTALCEDNVWGVRKSCALCFVSVSTICCPATRANHLTQLFVALLTDQSRWVRMSAYQSLGGFISTFVPSKVSSPSESFIDSDCDVHRRRESLESLNLLDSTTKNNLCIPSNNDNGQQVCNNSEIFEGVSSEHVSETISDQTLADVNKVDENSTGENLLKCDDPCDDSHSRGIVESLKRAIVCTEETKFEELSEATSTDNEYLISSDVNCVNSSWDSTGKKKYIERDEMKIASVMNVTEPDIETVVNFGSVHLHVGSELKIADCEEKDRETNMALMDVQHYQTCNCDSKVDDLLHSEDVHQKIQPKLHNDSLMSAIHHSSSVCCRLFRKGDGTPGRFVRQTLPVNITRTNSAKLQIKQTIVPDVLLEHYVMMTSQEHSHTIDTDIERQCAYSIPAVAVTLGPENWPILKDIYRAMALSLQPQVRRALAYSIHEMARILGSDITSSDLLPVFDDFIKDLDEVRAGIVQHLFDFFQLLKLEVRQEYLVKLPLLLGNESNHNWRFRQTLARQLLLLADLLPLSDVYTHIFRIAMTLAKDRVFQVRLSAYALLSRIIKMSALDDDWENSECEFSLITNEIIQRFALSCRFSERQGFVQICNCVLDDESMTRQQFTGTFLHKLLALHEDRVVNVRISLARMLSQHHLQLVCEDGCLHQMSMHPCIMSVIEIMSKDVDRNVKHVISVTVI